MIALEPLESLYDDFNGHGLDLPLPNELLKLYGRLHFPPPRDRPHVIGNFVSTLDGIVSLNVPGKAGGGPISGSNQHDRMVMGLLRSAADAVIVGAGTLRAVLNHVWTAEFIHPALSEVYETFQTSLGKAGPPLNVIVTASGELDLDLRVFRSDEAPVLVITTAEGERHIRSKRPPKSLQITAIEGDGLLTAQGILDAVTSVRKSEVILVEGGPQLIGHFLGERRLDELFLTVSPQIAGRDDAVERPGLVEGISFAPERPLWCKLVGVKRGGSHLFLRYSFGPGLGPNTILTFPP